MAGKCCGCFYISIITLQGLFQLFLGFSSPDNCDQGKKSMIGHPLPEISLLALSYKGNKTETGAS